MRSSTESAGTPSTRLPLIALAVAGVVALLSLLISTGGPPSTSAAAQTAAPPAVSAPAPDCGEPVGSLRPVGALPAPGAMPPGSPMAAIVARGRLIAGVDQGKYLTGFRDPATGLLQGSDVDVVRALAAAILGDPERVQYVVLDVADRAAAVADGRVDVLVNTFTITCARQRQVEFSAPYTTAVQRLLVPVGSGVREVEDLAGQRVCTSTGSTTADVLRDSPAGLDVLTLAALPDCVLELQAGRVAAVSSDDVILAGFAAQDPQTEIVGRALATASYGVGINRDQPDLVRFVNAVLERGRADGSLAASNQRWYADVDAVPAVAPAVYRD